MVLHLVVDKNTKPVHPVRIVIRKYLENVYVGQKQILFNRKMIPYNLLGIIHQNNPHMGNIG